MRNMNKFFTVLGHTYFSRLKSKSFIITTAIILLFITAMANMEKIVDFFASDSEETIIVIDEKEQYFSVLEQQISEIEEDLRLILYEESEEKGKASVYEGEYDGLIVLSYSANDFPQVRYFENSAVESWNQNIIEQQLQQIKVAVFTEQSGIDQATLDTIYEPIQFEKIALDEASKTEEELDAARGIVYVMLFVLYMAVIIYGQMIATDVATEKSSRVMEILISSASPITHMFSKIIGIALLGLTQMIIIFLYAIAIFSSKSSELTDALLQEFGFTSDNVALYAYAILFFLLGYLLYATIAAMLGSLVSRVEDVQQLTMPLVFLIMIAFFIAMFGLVVPDTKFITITSYIPFFTPMIMFLRIGMLDVPAWEIILSIVLLLITLVLFSLLSARIYRGGVLMYGPSRSLRDFKKAFMLTKKNNSAR